MTIISGVQLDPQDDITRRKKQKQRRPVEPWGLPYLHVKIEITIEA